MMKALHLTQKNLFITIVVSAVISAVSWSSGTIAQDDQEDNELMLEEIIVTAQRKLENAQDVPISMAIETGDSLEKKGIVTLEALSMHTPGLFIQDGGRTSNVAMRGIGSPGLDSVESSVGMYIDGVYFGRSRISRNPLFDMERVEILRGPQGTLYGRNTIGGAISMITATPSEELSGRILLESGNFNSHKAEAFITGGITDTLSARLAVLNRRRGTYMDNSVGPNGGGQDTEAYRLSLRWYANDDLEIVTKFEHMNHANVGSYAQITDDPFGVYAGLGVDTKIDRKQQVGGQAPQLLGNKLGGTFSTDSVAINATYELSDDYTLSSTTGWSEYTIASRDYITASPFDTLTIKGITDETEYWSQEFRLEFSSDNAFNFVAGLFFDQYDTRTLPNGGKAILSLGGSVLPATVEGLATNPNLSFLGPLQSNVADGFGDAMFESFRLTTPGGKGSKSNLEQDISTWSVFFEGSYEFNEQWNLIAGIRYTEEENKTDLAKGTFYLNGDGLPWGATPSGAELAAAAVANDPALAGQEALLGAVYGGVLSNSIGGSLVYSDLPGLIAAPGGTPAVSDKLDEDSVTPSLKLQFIPNSDAMYYLTVATGFKAGGFNSSNIQQYTREGDSFDNEDSVTLELGGKLTLAEGAASLNFAVFRTEFDDMQVGSITPQGASTVVNTGSAISQGVEIDGALRLTETITIGGAYAYLDSSYEDTDPLNCTGLLKSTREAAGEVFDTTACTLDLDSISDNELLRAPEHTASIYIEYYSTLSQSWDLQGYLGLNYQDEAFTGLDNLTWSDELALVGCRIALYNNPGNWAAILTGANLTDDDGLVLNQSNSGGAIKGLITTPRTYSLQLIKNF